MTVPVRLSGQGPYAFRVGTGAERTLISLIRRARR
jgi:hypothetical protein